MPDRIRVLVQATDPVLQLGVTGQLRADPEFLVLADHDAAAAEVAAAVVDDLDERTLCTIRALHRQGPARVVVIAGHLDDRGLVDAIEAGACGFLRREDTRADTLGGAIRRAARGEATMPPDLLSRLLGQVSRTQQHVLGPRGLSFSALTKRETEVLRLLADGHNTAEVAKELIYSERTVKNVLADVTRRLNLRNRTHAVAFALRQGLI